MHNRILDNERLLSDDIDDQPALDISVGEVVPDADYDGMAVGRDDTWLIELVPDGKDQYPHN